MLFRSVIIHGAVKRTVMAAAPHLRLVVGAAIGYERQDVAGATELGIAVANSPSIENFTGVAETTIGLMMQLGKRYKHKEKLLREGGWGSDVDRGYLLTGKTVGIVGIGNIGTRLTELVGPFRMKVLAYDPLLTADQIKARGATPAALADLLKQSDFVSVHCPRSKETTNMFDKAAFAAMKPSAVALAPKVARMSAAMVPGATRWKNARMNAAAPSV